MRKIFTLIFVGVLVMPQLCNSYAEMNAKVDKKYSNIDIDSNKDVRRLDSISVNYNRHTSTITISTAANRKGVEVHIYKEGWLMYEDKDDVLKSSSLSYTLTDEESGAYDVFVTVENGDVIEGTIVR